MEREGGFALSMESCSDGLAVCCALSCPRKNNEHSINDKDAVYRIRRYCCSEAVKVKKMLFKNSLEEFKERLKTQTENFEFQEAEFL
jgi:hypothetical protein